MKYATFIWILLSSLNGYSQKIIYSTPEKNDHAVLEFEIIGKIDNHYLIYKFSNRRHEIDVYDTDMQIVKSATLDFLPDRVIDFDFMVYRDHVIMCYQFQRNRTVFCAAADLGVTGELIKEPVTLDSVSFSIFASNRIFSVAVSEDKSRLLVSRRNMRGTRMDFSAIVYDVSLRPVRSIHQILNAGNRHDRFSEPVIDNAGSVAFSYTPSGFSDYSDELTLLLAEPGHDSLAVLPIDLQGRKISQPYIKPDNVNGHWLINAFYLSDQNRNNEGLFTACVNAESGHSARTAFNAFYSNNRNYNNSNSTQYNNLLPAKIILKKSGGFLIIAEDFYSETLFSGNSWNRFNPYDSYNNTGDYYLYNPYFNSYRPYYNSGQNRMRYFYNDILIAEMDTTLQMKWNQSLKKRQFDTDNENHLSFAMLNAGRMIHFLYIENSEYRSVISDNFLTPDGDVKKVPLIRNEEKNYEFMPRLARQVGADQMVMPFVYFNKIGFALIDW